jgi:hypothetical protein
MYSICLYQRRIGGDPRQVKNQPRPFLGPRSQQKPYHLVTQPLNPYSTQRGSCDTVSLKVLLTFLSDTKFNEDSYPNAEEAPPRSGTSEPSKSHKTNNIQ